MISVNHFILSLCNETIVPNPSPVINGTSQLQLYITTYCLRSRTITCCTHHLIEMKGCMRLKTNNSTSLFYFNFSLEMESHENGNADSSSDISLTLNPLPLIKRPILNSAAFQPHLHQSPNWAYGGQYSAGCQKPLYEIAQLNFAINVLSDVIQIYHTMLYDCTLVCPPKDIRGVHYLLHTPLAFLSRGVEKNSLRFNKGDRKKSGQYLGGGGRFV